MTERQAATAQITIPNSLTHRTWQVARRAWLRQSVAAMAGGVLPVLAQQQPVKPTSAPTAPENFYLCPMHPDVTDGKAGTCPRCNMMLVKTAAPEPRDFPVEMTMTPRAPRAGQPVKLRFAIRHPVSGKPVKDVYVIHDMPFHLFVVSQDFSSFQHIHPTQQSDGSFVVETMLPRAGYYKIFCDFFPKGGTPQVAQHHLVTAGFARDLLAVRPTLQADTQFQKTLDGTRFTLQFVPAQLFAGRPAELQYELTDAATGQPVSDLEPYLGAWGHTLILNADATDYLHSHPLEMLPEHAAARQTLTRPAHVVFETFFPRPDVYRIWSQFQRGQRLTTVSFTVDVPRLR